MEDRQTNTCRIVVYSNETYNEHFHEYLLTGKYIVVFINILKLVSKINILFRTNFDVIFHNTATIRSIIDDKESMHGISSHF